MDEGIEQDVSKEAPTGPGGGMDKRLFRIQVMNQISAAGLSRLPPSLYTVGKDVPEPDAILVRSADMHAMAIPASVRAIARAAPARTISQ